MKAFLLPICLLLSIMVSAQDSLKVNKPIFLHALVAYDFPKTYGFAAGTSIPFHSINKKNDVERLWFIHGQVSAYHQPYAYTMVNTYTGIGIRYIRSQKYFTELSFNQGLMRTIYDGKVYELDLDGNIKEQNLFGRTYLTSGLSWSANWCLDNRRSNLWFIQLAPSFWVQYPYNSFLKAHFSLQAGISYRLGNSTIKIQTKHKSG